MSALRTTLALLALAPLALASCKKNDPAPAAPPPAAAKAPEAKPAPTTLPSAPAPSPAAAAAKLDPGMPGALDEAAFKALHVLKPGQPAATKGQMIDLAGGKAYLSLPPNHKPGGPGVVVIHEWWGLNDNIKLWADRLAADGFAALAVDLYNGKVATTPDEAMATMRTVMAEKAQATLLAAHKFLAVDPRVLAKKRGAIGWCFGGRQTLLLSLAAPDLDAAVMYYGAPVTDVAQLKNIKAQLLGIFANKDGHIKPASVDVFEKALKEAGVAHRILRYDADHAFANPSQRVYDSAAAEAAWREARAFLSSKLK